MLTTELHELLESFRNRLSDYQKRFDDKMTAAEEAEGSALGERLKTEAGEEFAESSAALRRESLQKLTNIILKMRENAARKKPDPPTSDMLEKLNFLGMRNHGSITREELNEIAAFCQSSPDALKVVQDFAQKLGFPLSVKPALVGAAVIPNIDSLERNAAIILNLPKVNNRSEWFNEGFWNGHGDRSLEISQSMSREFFRLDKDLTDPDSTVSWLANLGNEQLTEFKNAVND